MAGAPATGASGGRRASGGDARGGRAAALLGSWRHALQCARALFMPRPLLLCSCCVRTVIEADALWSTTAPVTLAEKSWPRSSKRAAHWQPQGPAGSWARGAAVEVDGGGAVWAQHRERQQPRRMRRSGGARSW